MNSLDPKNITTRAGIWVVGAIPYFTFAGTHIPLFSIALYIYVYTWADVSILSYVNRRVCDDNAGDGEHLHRSNCQGWR